MTAQEASRPLLTVVVASFRSQQLVEECVDALDVANTTQLPPVPVLLARGGDGKDVRHLTRGRPWLRVIPTGSSDSIPELRGTGMLAAESGWVAVTEDHCLVDPDWLTVLLGETRRKVDVVGGGMGNARPGPVNWGAYFAEYGFFSSARPQQDGFVLITGANVMYGPSVVGEVAAWAKDGLWEDVVHQRLFEDGSRLTFAPSARVRQNGTYGFVAFCQDRYEHGRDYARVRLREQGVSRAVRLLTLPLLPFVLFGRVRRAARGEDPRMFRLAALHTFAFLTAWAVGEGAGYLIGSIPAADPPDLH